MPVRVPFQKGLCQKFHQPPGTGIDLGFFVWEDLSKPMSDAVFPLVISAEACPPSLPTNEQLRQPLPTTNAQITEAVIERRNDDTFQVKVIKQILCVNGVRYELRELFGIENSAEAEFDDSGLGKECVICMSEPKDTAVLPCRHMVRIWLIPVSHCSFLSFVSFPSFSPLTFKVLLDVPPAASGLNKQCILLSMPLGLCGGARLKRTMHCLNLQSPLLFKCKCGPTILVIQNQTLICLSMGDSPQISRIDELAFMISFPSLNEDYCLYLLIHKLPIWLDNLMRDLW